jgi:hypothetical protein
LLASLEAGPLGFDPRSLCSGPQRRCILLGTRPNLRGFCLCGENRSRHYASQAFLQSAHTLAFYHFTP